MIEAKGKRMRRVAAKGGNFCFRLWWFIPTVLGLTGTAVAAAPPIIIQKQRDVVLFQAPISAATRDQLFGLLDAGVNTIVVNSAGGDTLAGIDIGRQIRRRNLRIGVAGVCASGCAQYMFVAAKQRIVSADSLVVFHNTASSMLKIVESGKIPAVSRERLEVEARAERSFYSEIGLSDTLLLEPQAEMLTICYWYNNTPRGDDTDVEYLAQFKGWTPTKEYMEAVGVKVEGFWPSPATKDDVIKAYRNLFTPNFRWRALGPDKPATREKLDAAYKGFSHVCTEEELKAP